MAPTREDDGLPSTRQRVLSSAAHLYREQGVTGTGVLSVLADANAPRGSLYHHFPRGKAQLVAEALALSGDEITARLRAAAGEDLSAAQLVGAFVEGLARDLEGSAWRAGCPVATATLELAASDPVVADVCARAYADWQHVVAERLAAEGRQDPDGDAEHVLAVVEGALVLARAQRDTGPLSRAAARLATWLAG